jgi:hypothetical protein
MPQPPTKSHMSVLYFQGRRVIWVWTDTEQMYPYNTEGRFIMVRILIVYLVSIAQTTTYGEVRKVVLQMEHNKTLGYRNFWDIIKWGLLDSLAILRSWKLDSFGIILLTTFCCLWLFTYSESNNIGWSALLNLDSKFTQISCLIWLWAMWYDWLRQPLRKGGTSSKWWWLFIRLSTNYTRKKRSYILNLI